MSHETLLHILEIEINKRLNSMSIWTDTEKRIAQSFIKAASHEAVNNFLVSSSTISHEARENRIRFFHENEADNITPNLTRYMKMIRATENIFVCRPG